MSGRKKLGLLGAVLFWTVNLPVLAQEPVIVLSMRNVDELLNSARFMLSGAGAPQFEDQGGLLDSMIQQLTKEKGLIGIDRKRPVGGYLTIGQGGKTDVVVFLPFSDQNKFRELLRTIYPNQKQGAGGMILLQAEDQTYFAKLASGYCFIALLPNPLSRLPDPTKLTAGDHALVIDAKLSKIPDETKDSLAERFQNFLDGLQEEPEQPDAQPAVTGLLDRTAARFFRLLLKQSQQGSVTLDVDQKRKLVQVNVEVVPKPGTGLAKAITAYPETKPTFAALAAPQAALSQIFAGPLSDEPRKVFSEAIDEVAGRVKKRIDESPDFKTPAQKKAGHQLVDRIVKVMHATGEQGRVDSALMIDATPEGKLQVIGACKAARPEDVSAALEEFVKKVGAEPGTDRVQLDVAEHGGARIHAIRIEPESEWKNRLDEGPIHLAVGRGAVFFALGGDSLAAVKSAIDSAGKPGTGDRPPVSLRVQPAKIAALLDTGADPNLAQAREAWAGPGDHASFDLVATQSGARIQMLLGESSLRRFALGFQRQMEAEEEE
jgi:hypothetical protein